MTTFRNEFYNTMSITKAAIGTMYHIHEKQYPRSKKLAFTTIGNALNMRVGKEYATFEYNEFRTMVESNRDLGQYSLGKLRKMPNLEEDEMVYSDYAYQMLASNMPDVAEKFGIFVGDEAGSLYEEIETYRNEQGKMEEHRIWFRKGKSWKWEHTKSGEPLGPHGLHMARDLAERFGELAKPHVLDMSNLEKQKCENWLGIGKDEFTFYWNGWFFTDSCAYAVGYVCQVLAIVPNGAVSQLYEEKWGFNNPEFMDHTSKKWKHPRWFFVRNIEQFQGHWKQLTETYLNTLKQPPVNQQGASIIMPSGSGKSYYIEKQNVKDEFIDCDPLTWFANAQPHRSNSCAWNWDDHLKIICLQVDQVVSLAKKRRYWVMGATWWDGAQIDAIVILDEKEHRKRLKNKSDPFPDDFYDTTVKRLKVQLRKESETYGIRIFGTIPDCVEYIRKHFNVSQLKF